jgi:hypothetical protein
MALTIVIILIFFIACVIFAVKAKAHYPDFTDDQLLSQHRRFLDELDQSRKYVGAAYFVQKEKGSTAQAELTLRGFDVDLALREHRAASLAGRAMDWSVCRSQDRPPGISKNP